MGYKTNGIFELQIKNAEGNQATWTIDLKNTGTIYKGPAKSKANVTIILSDETFQQLANGKVRPMTIRTGVQSLKECGAQLDGQKAFMTGKLKTKGNMMFATKLDGVLKVHVSPSFVVY